MNRVVHFEIHAIDLDKMQHFYRKVFDWDIWDMGAQMGNYRLITTGSDTPGSSYTGINGALAPRYGEGPNGGAPVNGYVCTIEVEDIDETLAKIEREGGTVALEKTDVSGVGLLAYCKDPKAIYLVYCSPCVVYNIQTIKVKPRLQQ